MSESKKMSRMPRKLAQALIEAGVEHYDSGGAVQNYYPTGGIGAPGTGTSATPTTQGNKFDWGKFSEHYASANAPALLNDYGSMIKNIGIGMTPQSQFVASAPGIQGQNFMPQISALQARQAEVYGQQQSLAQALLAQSQGQGPNPAQMMLNQNTGQNVQGQAALMASQRGAGANPALMARQAALQGSGIQQQAVGQAATLAAQQQIAAQQSLMQQQQNMMGSSLQGENIQQNALGGQNQLSLGAQGINAQTAQGNADRASKGIGGIMQGIGGALALDDGGRVPGKAVVKGDSEKNDVVPALLSPGEIVIPRSHAGSEKKAIEFVKHLMKAGGGPKGYGAVMEARMNKGGKVCK